jgi:hypothetical protein
MRLFSQIFVVLKPKNIFGPGYMAPKNRDGKEKCFKIFILTFMPR